MELSKKTTILLTPELHQRLTQLAAQWEVSLGELVRRACEDRYGIVSTEDRIEAVRALAALRLPIADIPTMKKQSVVEPEELLP